MVNADGITFRERLFQFDVPTTNGLIYTKDSVVRIVDPLVCYFDPAATSIPSKWDLADAAGIAKATQGSDGFYVGVILFETPRGKDAQEILARMDDALRLVAVGSGNIVVDNVVSNFVLGAVSLVLKERRARKGTRP